MKRNIECPICGSVDGLFEETEPESTPNPVAWRWINQFGKEVISSNEELANLVSEKLTVEPLFLMRWEDKREQQTANAVDSAPSACTTAPVTKLCKSRLDAAYQAYWANSSGTYTSIEAAIIAYLDPSEGATHG